MKKQTRLISVVLCVALIFSMILSAIFIVTHTNHDCVGTGCEICHQIQICEQLLNKDVLDTSAYAQTALWICFFVFTFLNYSSHQSDKTLVSMKVKLSC